MKSLISAVLALSATLSCHAAFAAPGEYWEVTSKMEMPGMPFAMPATTSKVCMGKGQESDPRRTSGNKDCEMTDVKTSGNKTTWKARCNQNGEIMTGSGEQTVTANGYEGRMRFEGKSHGRDMNMSMNFSGKKLGSSCDTEEAGKKMKAQICDTSHFSSSADWVGGAEMFLNKDTPCPEQGKQLCEHVRKDAPRDTRTYLALLQHDQMRGVQISVARECHIDMDSTTRQICKTINERNYSDLSGYCPAEAKAFREAQRRKECEGRQYSAETRAEDLKRCLEGKGPKGTRSFTADEGAASKAGDNGGSNGMPSSGQILDGAKKLKGLFGF